jgi:hypothetical protein
MHQMAVALIVTALIAFAAFNLWLRQQRRLIVHRERLAALEKGVDLPSLALDGRQNVWNVQRILLLAGLCWIAIGISTFAVLEQLITYAPPLPPLEATVEFWRIPPVSFIPRGLQAIGLLPLGLGIAHLIVYFIERRKHADARNG